MALSARYEYETVPYGWGRPLPMFYVSNEGGGIIKSLSSVLVDDFGLQIDDGPVVNFNKISYAPTNASNMSPQRGSSHDMVFNLPFTKNFRIYGETRGTDGSDRWVSLTYLLNK